MERPLKGGQRPETTGESAPMGDSDPSLTVIGEQVPAIVGELVPVEDGDRAPGDVVRAPEADVDRALNADGGRAPEAVGARAFNGRELLALSGLSSTFLFFTTL